MVFLFVVSVGASYRRDGGFGSHQKEELLSWLLILLEQEQDVFRPIRRMGVHGDLCPFPDSGVVQVLDRGEEFSSWGGL